jgi:hypothetical protein
VVVGGGREVLTPKGYTSPGGVRIDGTGATLAEAPPLAMEQHYNRKSPCAYI